MNLLSYISNGSPTGWNYYITDHLGSTRMVVGSDNTVKETVSYYPFGSEKRIDDPAQISSDFLQPYRFTGKELDRLNGLNMYDFGARWYDVAGVPMWTSVYPLAEKYYHVSPYAYCEGNPVMLVDPDGKQVWDGTGAYCCDNKDLKKLADYLANHDDPNSIMIVAHGVVKEGEKMASSINIQSYNAKTNKWEDNYISNGEQLNAFLTSNSKVWQRYKEGKIDAEDLHIVFYSCSSSNVVKQISSDRNFKDITSIAPNKDVGVSGKSQVFVADMIETTNGKTFVDSSPEKGFGSWNTIRNGRIPWLNSQYPGDRNLKPGTANFEYKHPFF